jgi:hypothetical protein
MEKTFRVLDGSSVTLAGPFADLADPGATSFAVFRLDGRQQEFGAGGRAFARDDAAALGIELTERYFLPGFGTLHVGSTERTDTSSGAREKLSLGAWEGLGSSVRAVLSNASSADVIALFDQFVIDETAEGPAMRPKDRARVGVDRGAGLAPSLIHGVSRLGLVDVAARTSAMDRILPSGGGRRTPNGELFIDRAGGRSHVTAVSSTAVAKIMPDPDMDESTVVGAAAELQAEWQPG